ncbi:uncharacterized protein LOC111831070 [Capsella rubella]|uniref:uncharacterized protein LOC111831070 n=1 Tax=Capsella rubella TaxID=81985 RepID=UPI000CD53464|nr:uncharacterized protein LOC111831070 [Capsella rubella]
MKIKFLPLFVINSRYELVCGPLSLYRKEGKALAQALPIYFMSCFLLSKAILSKLSNAFANFWWKTRAESNGIHWIARDKLCTQFLERGLGFQTLEEFNESLLAKQLWRLLRFSNTLLRRVLRGRYYWYSDPLQIVKANRPSYGWRSIFAVKPLIVSDLRRTIGSGMLTRVWVDPWIPIIPPRPAKTVLAFQDLHLYANDLLDRDNHQWNLDHLNALVDPMDIPLILGIRPSRTSLSDEYSWVHTKSGNYIVKSGYWAARNLSRPSYDRPFQGPDVSVLGAQVWKTKTTRKLKNFMWQCLSGYVATCQRIFDRHIGNERGCFRCGFRKETINHLLFECPPARKIWALSSIPTSGTVFLKHKPITGFLKQTPDKTLLLATHEAQVWRQAMETDVALDPPSIKLEISRSPCIPPLECQCDASWLDSDPFSGMGWILLEARGNSLRGHSRIGLKSVRRSLSPLHAEFDGLLWAMECMIEIGQSDVYFATNCSDILAIL